MLNELQQPDEVIKRLEPELKSTSSDYLRPILQQAYRDSGQTDKLYDILTMDFESAPAEGLSRIALELSRLDESRGEHEAMVAWLDRAIEAGADPERLDARLASGLEKLEDWGRLAEVW